MANNLFMRFALTGGATNSLDGIDGNWLSDGDVCDVATSTGTYKYRLNATSAAAESSPHVISPDTNAGNKRWLLTSLYLSGKDAYGLAIFSGDTAKWTGIQLGRISSGMDMAVVAATNQFISGSVAGDFVMRTNSKKMLLSTDNGTTAHATLNGSALCVGITAPIGSEKMRVFGQIYCDDNVSALTFTDRTPFYEGDALSEILKIKGKDGEIDHSSLPDFAKKTHKYDIVEDKFLRKDTIKNEQGESVEVDITEPVKVGEKTEEVRDLGAMISLLTVAVQQLSDRLDTIEKKGASK